MICKLKYHIPYVTHLQAKEIKATCNPQCETQKRKRKKEKNITKQNRQKRRQDTFVANFKFY